MRRHICYILLQLKSAFKYIPKLFAGTLLFGFLTCCIAFACINSSNAQTNLFFKIAVVLPENDTLVNLGFGMLSGMESLKDYCEFIQTDQSHAEEMLKKGEVYGIVYIPEGFVEDVLSGRNTPATVILPDNPGIETSLFRSVLNAGSNTLAYVQSGIYALTDTYSHFGMTDRISSATDELNEYYIRFVINRNNMYDIQTLSATDSLTNTQYYICSGIVIIIIFSSFLLGSFITGESRGTQLMLKRSGIGHCYACSGRILAVSLIYSLLLTMLLFAVSLILPHTAIGSTKEILYTLSPVSLLGIFICVSTLTAFFYAAYTIAGNGLYGMLFVFCLDIIMIYSCGLLLPTAYLPKAAVIIGRLFPAGYAKSIMETLYNENADITSIFICIGMLIFYTIISTLITKIEMRRQ